MLSVYSPFTKVSHDDGHTFTKPHPVGLEHGSPPHIMRHSSGVLIASYGIGCLLWSESHVQCGQRGNLG